ncbi:MAG TPA: DUF2066 domain-containing protein [Gammaproteobacteria bacterium]|nr:DUF2066 domain-containing protein [Gammaproteobacteria bacterium]
MNVGRVRVWLGCLLLPMLMWAGNLSAAPVEHLFQAEVPVADQGADERGAAVHKALAEVLVRLTGEQNVAQQPSAAALLDHPDRFVQQYRYRRKPPPDVKSSDTSALWLWVRFDARGVEKAMRQAGLPLWGRERPLTLIWLAVQDGGQRYLVASDADSDMRRAVQREAHRRGVPVLFPLLDLEDQSRVQFPDVWGGFVHVVTAASKRYHAPDVLIGRLSHQAGGNWSARWTMELDGDEINWEASDPSVDTVLAAGVGGAADRLAARLAVSPGSGGQTQLSLTVDGVQSLADYARVSKYLSSLTPVQQLAVKRVDGSQVTFDLDLDGATGTLDQAIALGSVLQPVSGSDSSYRLSP